jgi:hypothetical protein
VRRGILFIIIGVIAISCYKTTITTNKFETQKVIIVVMDGARYTETWGDSNHTYIPYLSSSIKFNGCVSTNFMNEGSTYTSPGHLALIAGKYYNLDNSGTELPPFTNIFQHFNQTYPNKKSWIIASKDKLEVLANTSEPAFANLFMPNTDCGISGLGSGYRSDSITLVNALTILDSSESDLTLINFSEPDVTAHQKDSLGYLNQIRIVDSLIHQIYLFTESHSAFKGKTTLFITNDHGRHDKNHGGLAHHGDNCLGCRQIMLFATGPDFKNNFETSVYRQQIDVAATVADLMYFPLPNKDGEIMTELYDF